MSTAARPAEDGMSWRKQSQRLLVVVAVALLVAIGRLLDGWEADEVQHLHAAWLVGHGLVPYRDYFDHHMPFFHIAAAPLALWGGAHYGALLVASRLIGGAIALSGSLLFGALAPRGTGMRLAAPAACLFLVARYDDFIFLLRPDFVALACLLLAAVIACRQPTPTLAGAASIGATVGMSILFTQKSAAIAPAFALWFILKAVRSEPDLRVYRWGNAVVATVTMLLPLAMLLLWLQSVSALTGWWYGTVMIATHWTQPGTGTFFLQEPMLVGGGMLVLGLGGALLSVWRLARHGTEEQTGDGLLGLMALLGLAGFLRTPAPTHHAFVFTAQVWLLACAVRQVPSLAAAAAGITPLGRGRTAAIVLAALGLSPMLRVYNIAAVLAVWGLVWLALRRFLHGPQPWAHGGPARVLIVLMMPSVIVCLGNVVERAVRRPVFAQLAAMTAIDQLIPQGKRVLTAWPIVTPARPHATYHWFSDDGMYTSLPEGNLRKEYVDALNDPTVAVVTWNPEHVYRYLPEMEARLAVQFVEHAFPRDQAKALMGLRAYVRRRQIQRADRVPSPVY